MSPSPLSESACHSLFHSAWLYVLTVDAAGVILNANEPARRLLDLDSAEGGRNIRSTLLSSLYFPVSTNESSLRELHGETIQEVDLVTPAGVVRWFEWRVTPLGYAGPIGSHRRGDARPDTDGRPPQTPRFLCVGTDVSRRHQAEERNRVLFDESKDMIFTCAPDDRITEVNDAGVRLLGARTASALINRKITDFYVSVADRDFYRHRMANVGYVKDLELVMRREGGRRIVVLETSTAVKDGDGNILEYHGIIKDISERIRLEQDHMKMNIELAETNRKLRHTQSRLVQQEKLASVGRLAAGVAHEINNPLSFVKSNFDSLKEYVRRLSSYLEGTGFGESNTGRAAGSKALPAEIRHILGDLETLFGESEHGFDRMVSIVQGLRNFARTGPADREPYNLNTAVDTTLAILRNEYKHVATIERHLEEVPDVYCVPDEINQVILNVLVNSVQAIRSLGDERPRPIRISTGTAEASVYCRIEDSGPGIPAKDMPQIFEPFFTTKPHGQGTGLGLSISYDIIVNKHGGDLTAENLPDGGASFLIQLPRGTSGAPDESG
ncbi:MAG: ATP-binding protein [Spirochaetaceae bacterium]